MFFKKFFRKKKKSKAVVTHNPRYEADKKYFNSIMAKCNAGRPLTYREEQWLEHIGHYFDE